MKKLLSIIIAVVITTCSIIPVFATEQDFNEARNKLLQDNTECENYYLLGGRITSSHAVLWSENSRTIMNETIDDINNSTYLTIDDVNAKRQKLDDAISKMCVYSGELKFNLEICELEDNSNNYYDNDTWNEFENVVKNAKIALDSNNDEQIHKAYVDTLNAYNKLCLYNKTMGDVNNDGKFNISDATLLQKYIAGKVVLTSSQKVVLADCYCYDLLKINISVVTNMSKILVNKLDFYNGFLPNFINNSSFSYEQSRQLYTFSVYCGANDSNPMYRSYNDKRYSF